MIIVIVLLVLILVAIMFGREAAIMLLGLGFMAAVFATLSLMVVILDAHTP